MRIHLLCDQKWRDLPNLVVLKLRLEGLGHTVLLSSTKDARPMIAAFRPDCVVLNHLWSTAHRNLAKSLRAAGIAVVILPTEGTARPEFRTLSAGEFSDFSLADLILAWNEQAAKDIRLRWGFDEERVPAVGCTRFDFYHPRFTSMIDTREAFCTHYDLNPDRSIVTWATQYVYAHLEGDRSSPRFQQWQKEFTDVGSAACYERIGLDFLDLPEIHAEGRRAAAKAFIALAKALPEVQFLIKPHPIEELEFYRSHVAESGCVNVRFCPATYIWNALNATDIQLHRQCTTAVENWLWNKPSIEMAMTVTPELSWQDREAGSDTARDAHELIALVRRYVSDGTVSSEQIALRWNYIHRWFGPLDGRRCDTAAEKISAFLRARGKRRYYLHPIKGLNDSTKDSIGAVIRYRLNMLPNSPLIDRGPRQQTGIAHDKLITRADVLAYENRLREIAA